jgi:hypothetical protein
MSKDQIKKKNYTVHNDDKNVLAFRFVLVFFIIIPWTIANYFPPGLDKIM